MTPRLFHCAFYFDRSTEDFELHGIFTKPEDADADLASIDARFDPKVVAEYTLEGIKEFIVSKAQRRIAIAAEAAK